MPPPRSLNFVFLTHILASGGSNNTSCQVGGVFVAYRQPSVVGGLLISGLLVIPCISAGTLAISVGSKVILSNFLWFHDDNISVTLLFFGCCINRTLLCPGSSNVCTPSSCLYRNMTKLSLMLCPLSANHGRTPMGGEHAR